MVCGHPLRLQDTPARACNPLRGRPPPKKTLTNEGDTYFVAARTCPGQPSPAQPPRPRFIKREQRAKCVSTKTLTLSPPLTWARLMRRATQAKRRGRALEGRVRTGAARVFCRDEERRDEGGGRKGRKGGRGEKKKYGYKYW